MVSLHDEDEEPNGRSTQQLAAEAPNLSEPQKAYLTGEFVVVV